MAKLVYALNVSLDGYVDHDAFAPGPELFRHFTEDVRGLAGLIYGRGMYEVMRYWDEEHPEWDEAEREYAEAWRSKPKWVVSSTLESAGPNATLITDNVEAAISGIREQVQGTIEVAGTVLAANLGDAGLIDEYQLYLHPLAVGSGKPYFARSRGPLSLVGTDIMGGGVVRLTYVPAS
jgi:dihydrofolate reductase